MARYWEKRTTGITVDGGLKTVVTLKCPSRCALSKLAVAQLSGTPTTFVVNLFSTLAAAQAFAAGTLTGIDTYRVVKQIDSDAAGTLLKLFTGSDGVYENQEGGQSNRTYQVYMVLEPAGAEADLDFAVTLGVLLSLDGS